MTETPDGHIPMVDGRNGNVTCEWCGVEMQFDGDGVDRSLDSYSPVDGKPCPDGTAAEFDRALMHGHYSPQAVAARQAALGSPETVAREMN